MKRAHGSAFEQREPRLGGVGVDYLIANAPDILARVMRDRAVGAGEVPGQGGVARVSVGVDLAPGLNGLADLLAEIVGADLLWNERSA